MVRLESEIRLEYVAAESCTFLMNVQPVTNTQQRVIEEGLEFSPTVAWSSAFTHGGNRFLRFVAGPGEVWVRSRAVVDILHHIEHPDRLAEVPPAKLPASVLPFMLPSRYCESDRLMADARNLFGHLPPGYRRVQAIAKWVHDHVTFAPGTTNWSTSASDVFAGRKGVCRDFAHTMIALCRALNMPARFVTGIDYGADPALGPMDFHAYVEVYLSGRWYLFDPSEISPTTGLIRIGTGRDAADVALATIVGAVTSAPPRVTIAALTEQNGRIAEPRHTDLAVSTAAPPAVAVAPEAATL